MSVTPRPVLIGERAANPRAARAAEVTVIGLACLAPWAIGAVDDWAVLCLDAGVAFVGLLTALSLWRTGRRWPVIGLPSVALMGLVLLALFQAMPLPVGLLKTVAPSSYARRLALLPAEPERVSGDERTPVALPSPTLSSVPDETVRMAGRLIAALVLFQCVLELGGGYASLRRFGVVTSINATLLALFALLQGLTWNGKIFWVYPSPYSTSARAGGGPFVNRNNFAEYLNLGLGFSIGLLLSGRRASDAKGGRGSQLWAAYATGVIVVGIVVSQWRGGFLSMVAASAVTFVLLKGRIGKIRIGLGLGLGAVLLIALALLAAVGDSSPYLARLATIFDAGDTSLGARLSIWKYSLLAVWDHPVWGLGLGSFRIASAPYFLRDLGYFFTRAENEYVDLLTEGGLLGLGLGLMALTAIVRRTRGAWLAAKEPREWGLVLGASFGGMAVAFHSLSDFGLHIPGVGFTVVVLAAHLYRLGFRRPDPVDGTMHATSGLALAVVVGLAVVVPMSSVIARQYRQALREYALANSRIPRPGSATPSADEYDEKAPDLERDRLALERALSHQPDWCEGYLWLGKVHLNLYKLAEERRTGGTARSTFKASSQAGPLWLLQGARTPPAIEKIWARASRQGDPVCDHLVPALRCFLEARRCCPYSALAQAKIASLAFLFERGDPAIVYAERALGLTGRDEEVVDLIAEVAVRIGRPDLAARCWRKSLELRPEVWPLVADSAAESLPPDQILEQLLVRGQHTLAFAERLYSAPKDREVQERFLRATLDRLPRDPDLDESERIWLESQARAGLKQRDQSRRMMAEALSAEPRREEWRVRYIEWLLAWGDPREAHRQALAGVRLNPRHSGLRQGLKKAVSALSRGGTTTGSVSRG